MPRSSRSAHPTSDVPDHDAHGRAAHGRTEEGPANDRASAESQPSLAGLGIAGVSRRRIVTLTLLGLALWIAIGFAGQATDAARAAERASQEEATNAALADRLAGLDEELDLVVQRRWFLQQARAYNLGSSGERPFAIAPGAPSLPPDAPGSPERRIGTEVVTTTPLESWLDVLFGPAAGS